MVFRLPLFGPQVGTVGIIVGLILALAIGVVTIASLQGRKKMRVGHVYRLTGMTPSMWQVPHPRYGAPSYLVAWLIGIAHGTRTWYTFEVQRTGKDGIRREVGTLGMPQEDIDKITVEDLGPYRESNT